VFPGLVTVVKVLRIEKQEVPLAKPRRIDDVLLPVPSDVGEANGPDSRRFDVPARAMVPA
jgi:hypothetical protein